MTVATEHEAELLDSKKRMISGTYLGNAWYVAAWSDDLTEGQLLARTILKEPVVLYRKSDGAVVALGDRCPHRFAPLHMGKIVHGDRVQCPYHGLEFDQTGACVLNPHGTRAEIHKADVIFRAVVVAPGRHVVRFSFHPFAGALAELAGKLSPAQ